MFAHCYFRPSILAVSPYLEFARHIKFGAKRVLFENLSGPDHEDE